GNDDFRVDVDVAVIDTGIDLQHPDLNVAGGVNCTLSIFSAYCATGGDDDHYHGTHVAGTIGALDNGGGVVG
ncbi:MAG: S8 family serine peptidase, partial [Gammaproteobacteria bacterium]|nr:S8 family serine peptidase [Gammaproteobacteria bacterium]